MNTNLLTPDGFPRADIDVAQSMISDPTSLLSTFEQNNLTRVTL